MRPSTHGRPLPRIFVYLEMVCELVGQREDVWLLTFEFEREKVGEMLAFVVASEEKDAFGIPNFESPEVEEALSARGISIAV